MPEKAPAGAPEKAAEEVSADAAPENGGRVDGRHARWAAHRSARRRDLARLARRAVHRLGPDISMEQIAAEAGTSKPIIYRYFTDKAGLQAAVGQAVIDDLGEAMQNAVSSERRPREQIAGMIAVYLDAVEASPNVFAFVAAADAETSGPMRGFIAEIEELVAHVVLPALRPSLPPSEADRALARIWAAGVVGLVRSSAECWLAAREAGRSAVAGIDRDELTAHMTDWLWEGGMAVVRRTAHRSTQSARTE